jgi:hypothetical protein
MKLISKKKLKPIMTSGYGAAQVATDFQKKSLSQ